MKSSLLAGLASFIVPTASLQTSAITDITKPYLGEYECKSATLGKKNLLDSISSVTLTLLPDGTFVLRYQDKKGKKHEETGNYEYDAQRKSVRITKNVLIEVKRDLTLENGVLYGSMKLGLKTLTIAFEQK